MKYHTVRTSHGSNGPKVVGHRTLRVLDVPCRRQGGVVAPRVQMDMHRRVVRVSLVSGRTALTTTDLLYLDIVQQEASFVTNCDQQYSDFDGRRRVVGYEVINVLLPISRSRIYGECRVETWQSDEAKFLRVEVVAVGEVNVERHSVLRHLRCCYSLLYVTADDIKKRLAVLCSDVAGTGCEM